MTPSHVLVPLDGSPLADDALEFTFDVFSCQVTVLNVVTPLDTEMSEGGVLDQDEKREETARKRANQLIETAATQAAAKNRQVETAVETGHPAETIIQYITDHDIDHVIMGGHGGDRSRLTRRLLGTVTTAVIGEAPVSVTVVR